MSFQIIKWDKMFRINFMIRMKLVAMKCTFICCLIRDVNFCHRFSFSSLDIISLFKKLLRNENALSQRFLGYFINPPTDPPFLSALFTRREVRQRLLGWPQTKMVLQRVRLSVCTSLTGLLRDLLWGCVSGRAYKI